ncbi:MAG: exo-beta-N-acetylmuramidase NamZ domain-containing protein, partial [Gemmatimonadaceae bacterium]
MFDLRSSARFLRSSTIPLVSVGWIAISTCGAQQPRVRLGIDVLLSDSLHIVSGKRVGLITNHTGRDAEGVSSIDRLARAPGVRLTALYGPEHGLRGIAKPGEHVASTVDSATGVPIYSLYGETRTPTPEMMKDIDVLVFDIQDVGARVYTYPWTMALAAEAATRAGKTFVVLDRPDPIRADRVDGGVLDPKFRSFVGA